MRLTKRSKFILMILSMIALTACAQPGVNDSTESEHEGEEALIEDEHEPDLEGENDAQMEALISEKIGDCHLLNFILSKNKTREEWSATIDRMIQKGAKINAEEKESIIEWLVSRNE